MKGGFLVYKCRRCKKLNKSKHVPNGLMYMAEIVSRTNTLALLDVCNCKDGELGISDLIGFEKDKSII